jgi:hypothetical protein
MKKIIIALSVILFTSTLFSQSTSLKTYITIHSKGQDTQLGVKDGVLSLYDADSGVYWRFSIKDGKIEKKIKIDRKEELPTNIKTYSYYCPFHHPAMIGLK